MCVLEREGGKDECMTAKKEPDGPAVDIRFEETFSGGQINADKGEKG